MLSSGGPSSLQLQHLLKIYFNCSNLQVKRKLLSEEPQVKYEITNLDENPKSPRTPKHPPLLLNHRYQHNNVVLYLTCLTFILLNVLAIFQISEQVSCSIQVYTVALKFVNTACNITDAMARYSIKCLIRMLMSTFLINYELIIQFICSRYK